MKTLLLLFLSGTVCFGAAYTSSQNGNWSASATWGGAGVPASGDTASIGHNVTVDVNTTVGTSPNDATTAAVTWTAARTLTIAPGVVFTVQGNLSDAFNLGILAAGAGSQLVFDNSSSGGTPLYGPVFSLAYRLMGSEASPVLVSAPSGRTHSALRARVAYGGTILSNVNISRMGATTMNVVDMGTTYDLICTNVNFDGCNQLIVNQAAAASSKSFLFDAVRFSNSVDGTSLQLQVDGAKTGGTRRLRLCVVDKTVVYLSKGVEVSQCAFLGGFNVIATYFTDLFRLNFSVQGGLLNSGNGALFTASVERNYFSVSNAVGNSHFIAPTALLGADNVVSQNIFESHAPDLTDSGDCVIIHSGATSGTNKVVGRNNIVLPGSYTNNVTSGTMLTVFTSASTSQWYHCTANVNDSLLGGPTVNGMFAIAEASTGVANQVGALKANLAWGSSANQGWFVVRQSGNVKDIITAAGADYNWRYNSKTGDNQLGYEDKAAANTLWTAGDAVAAGVDSNQGSGDPQFYDFSRNLASWAVVRGYGSTYTNALAAIQSNPSRAADLIAYIFEGFRPGNSAARNASHDGACVGAANFYKAGRSTNAVYTHRTSLSRFGI